MRATKALEDCIYRNARNLAAGPDDADTIAKGVVFLCTSEENNDGAFSHQDVQRFHETLSQPDAIEVGIKMYVTDQARAVALQSRAAHCPPVPIPNSN